jgi:conjugative transposon TraN protein
MKKFLIVVSLILTAMVKSEIIRAQTGPSFTLMGLTAQKVPLTDRKMTNLVFPVAIRTGIKVSRDVLVQKVKGVENVIELKAARAHFSPTNLSVFGLDGRLYSFDLEYADSPSVLNFAVVPAPSGKGSVLYPERPSLRLTGLPVAQVTLAEDARTLTKEKGFLHSSIRNEKMRLQVEGIYLKDSLLWFTLRVKNGSQVPYYPEYVRLFVQNRTKAKRTAIQQAAMEPVYEWLPDRVAGKSAERFALGFRVFTVPRDQQLWLEVAEPSGGRLLKLRIGYKTVLKARQVRGNGKENVTNRPD